MSDLALSILALSILVMAFGAWLSWRTGDRRRAGLMLALAVILAINVAIWLVPVG